MGAGDAAFLRALALQPHPRQAEGVHAPDEGVRLGQQLQQRAHQHIPRGAHVTFDVKRPHASIPFIRLIRFARKPAPKPLSMFTTDMPLAQALSMDSNADSPPKLAP